MTTNLPRDVFLYLLAVITLITVAVSFGIVVFQMINVYIPDVVSDAYMSRSSYLSTMRSALAAVVIVLPVFLWVSRFLRKDIIKSPEKRDLKIRRWLLYLTLFIAALVIIGDLVTLLRSFLEGELSQRFILKVVAILFIAGSVLVHYLSELKDKGKEFKWVTPFDWTVTSVVVAGIIAGFFIAGSPQNQRLVRLDEQRVSDLQSVQWQIINYWQRKESLPVQLTDMADPISGSIIPRDPETGESYEYRTLNQLTFELCAVFSTVAQEDSNNLIRKTVPMPASPEGVMYPELESVWWHSQGRTCFERTIDPDLYPVIQPPKGF